MPRIGNMGQIQLVTEATYGTDPGVGYLVQHGRAASLQYQKALLPNPRLTMANPSTRSYGTQTGSGEIEIAYDDSRAVIGDLLANAGRLATNTYTIDGASPDGGVTPAADDNSMTIQIDYGGYALSFTGCKLQSIRWEFNPEQPIVCKATVQAQDVAEITAFADPADLPAVSGVVWHSDISTMTIGGTATCFISGSIQVNFPLIGGIDRQCLGGLVKEPVWAGQTTVDVDLVGELGDETGADTEAIIGQWVAGTGLSSIAIGDFIVTSPYVMGDAPTLGDGITQFNLKAQGNGLLLTTTA